MVAKKSGRERSCKDDDDFEIDTERVDEATLALMYLVLHEGCRAWKGFDWDTLDRLHKKGLISNPASKAKSIVLSEEGLQRSRELFHAMFEKRSAKATRNNK